MSSPSTTPPQPDATPSLASTPVAERGTKPKGVIPKNLQSWVWLAILLVVAVGLFFSSSTPRKSSAANGNANAGAQTPPPAVGGLTPEQVQKRLQDQDEQARRAGPNPPPPGQAAQPGDPGYNPDGAFLAASQPATPSRDPLEEEQRKREYLGRYASNIALSYRPDARGQAQTPTASVLRANAASDDAFATSHQSGMPALPANFSQQLENLQNQQQQLQQVLAQQQQSSTTAIPPAGPQAQQAQAAPAPSSRKTVDLNSSTGKMRVIFEGAILESVLVNRLNGDFAGPVVCQITNDLYSHDHATILIPAGTRVLGETKKVDAIGQTRLAVTFHRLIMPDGYAVDLDQAPALNQIGETALHDKVNNHYFKIFGSSIAVGAIAGLSTIGTNNSAVTGLPTSSADQYRQGVASSLSQSSLRILDKFLNIPPTITIREGHRVRIFLTADLQVPAYADHRIPSDL